MTLPKNRREHIEGFINQIKLSKLSPEVSETVKSIAKQFEIHGDVSQAQYNILRRCSLATCERRMKFNNSWESYYRGFRG
jgi:hypothetical protein